MPDAPSRDAILAEAAGLGRAWADHPADVAEAITAAAKLRNAFRRPASPAAEPMPPYAAPQEAGA
ncbi:hypothetical protein JYK14_18060 [Siccirubricoccus sp. KC 17139]|uniref:Uncharacterized protein n=1 Tax=Siccirubricoccus soli TaxID=2899147 RepID=A0ABT1D816_9PROT|nr:hypothetical protein [Siccirubricoccus soli]MCO6418051.1 hypothetical protein [Siccirubricoccus soli]MCP2684186.1 hypothetical protein [Siccirubricoccus soli]